MRPAIVMSICSMAALTFGCGVPMAAPAANVVRGRVDLTAFPSGAFRTHAAMAAVANGATVSLLDPTTGQTLSTALTDASGNFLLTFAGFTPGANPYYLEAVKGLNADAAGNDAIRVRTLIQQLNGGWESMTNAIPNVGLVIDKSSTAIALIASLRAGTATPVNTALVGGVSPMIGILQSWGNPDVFTPGSLNISQAEYGQAAGAVAKCLTANVDPFSSIVYDAASGNYLYDPQAIALSVGGIAPTTGPAGTTFVIAGRNFNPTYGSNTVKFNGVAATLTGGSATTLTGTVPSLPSGTLAQVTVQTGTYLYLGPSFQVP